MASLKDEALNYSAPETKNIADLDRVPVDIPIEDDSFEYDGKIINVKIAVIDGQRYKVPKIVLKNLKEILKKKPGLTAFSVSKTGEGLKTSYTVIPLE